jgi:hypothetical protein
MIETRLVHIPAQADWLPQYLHEMAVFPKGKYDDQVDSTSQALDWVKDGVFVLGVVEYIRSEDAKLSLRSQSHAAEPRQLEVARMPFNRRRENRSAAALRPMRIAVGPDTSVPGAQSKTYPHLN